MILVLLAWIIVLLVWIGLKIERIEKRAAMNEVDREMDDLNPDGISR